MFGTLQQRLPSELRLAGITSIEAANHFLAERFVPDHDRRFAVAAAEPGTAFVPFACNLGEILCIQEERQVGNDNCVRYQGLTLQIPVQAHRHHFVKARVRGPTPMPTAPLLSSMARAVLPATAPTAPASTRRQIGRLTPLGAHAPWTCGLKLTRFRGHPNVGIFGVHDGKEAGTVCAGVPPADD